jgi:uncharacterized protein YqeY
MTEKERRKQLLKEYREKQREEFEQSLPIERKIFKNLFDYLDNQLEKNSCDHTTKMTVKFLEKNQVKNIQDVLNWLADNSGYCDCEILGNVEEKF